jgi:hypothetical protein
MFVPFNEFTREKFKNLRQELKDKHGNETNHRISYLDLNGFGKNKLNKLSKDKNAIERKKFNNAKDKLIDQWERKTGNSWPTEMVKNKRGVLQPKKYDAHHLIEQQIGGAIKWWNIHPAKNGSEHQGGIHRKKGPASVLLKSVVEIGKIFL